MSEPNKKIMDRITLGVLNAIESHEMIALEDSVLVGVSGGPDSTVLLHILLALQPCLKIRQIAVAHMNHCLRGSRSDGDAEFVTTLCRRLHVPCFHGKQDVLVYQRKHKLSLEEAARRVRYRFLFKTARQHRFSKIALGHHANDNAESILMYMLRGSGILGISGIPPVRDGIVIRPLIRLTRSEIMDYVRQKKLATVRDDSNYDPRFTRNRIRHTLIPVLKNDYNPKVVQSLNRLADILACENDWLEHLCIPLYENALCDSRPDRLVFCVPELKKIHTAALRRIFRKAISHLKKDARHIGFAHLETAAGLLDGGPQHRSIDLPDGIRIERYADRLIVSILHQNLRKVSPNRCFFLTPNYEYIADAPGILRIPEINGALEISKTRISDIPDIYAAGQRTAFFDMSKVNFPLVVRNFRSGDRFVPLGMTGSQKLKEFFINSKISRQKRSRCPILLSRGRIVWVVGYRIDESVKLTSSTKDVLKIDFLLPDPKK